MSAEQRLLAEAGVGRARARLDELEQRLAQIETILFAVEERLDAIEQRDWLPSSADLQARRYEAVRSLRARGLSITAIARRTRMSRSRVGALVAAMPTPAIVRSVTGSSYPARTAAAKRRRRLAGAVEVDP